MSSCESAKRTSCARIVLPAVVVLLGFLSPTSKAFDGQRRGFAIGVGAGWGAVTHLQVTSDDMQETSQSWTFVVPIGWGLSNTDLIAFLPAPSFFKSDLFDGASSMQGLWSVRWYHYFAPSGPSAFVSGGAGRAVFNSSCGDLNAAGVGVGLSAGYEFLPHCSIEAQYFHGWTSEGNMDFGHDNLSIILVATAY